MTGRPGTMAGSADTRSAGSEWSLAVDFGTYFTCAAIRSGDRPPELLRFGQDPYLRSLVAVGEDGQVLTGDPAASRAAIDPAAAETFPKRALVALRRVSIGGRHFSAVELVATVLERVLATAVRWNAGHLPCAVTLTHPAAWGTPERGALVAAAAKAGLPEPYDLVPEPVAAARFYLARTSLQPGRHIAVYDLGAGTLDTAVLRGTETGFEIVGEPGGNPELGGADFDDHLWEYVVDRAPVVEPRWYDYLDAAEAADPRHAQVRANILRAKVELSDAPVAHVALPPDFTRHLRVTRREYERLVEDDIAGSVRTLAETVARAGVRSQELAAVYLTGGASRTPLVSTLIGEEFGQPPELVADPKATVALGALSAPAAPAVARDTTHTTTRNGAEDGSSELTTGRWDPDRNPFLED